MSIIPYIQIARPDHWFKNIFILPGVVLVYFFFPELVTSGTWLKVALGFVVACLVASSNYVLNEVLDAEKDKFHPVKKERPVPSGQVKIPYAYAEWLILAALGFVLAFSINTLFGLAAVGLWVMGCLYNIPPIRLKDVAYGDVLSESINNPIRLVMGWYSMGCVDHHPPLSVILAYWMFGAFLMAMKRFAEFRMIEDQARAAQYRHSFAYYNEERLIESIFFYGAFFGIMSGVFITRYQLELVLATPVVAYALAYYMHLGFKPNSPVQNPEHLWRQKKLVLIVTIAFGLCTFLLLYDIPFFTNLIAPSQLPPS